MKLLYGHPQDVIHFVGSRIPLIRARMVADPNCQPFGLAYGIGVLNNDNHLIAGVVYHGWQPDFQSVEMSFAADTPKWLSKPLIVGLMNYAWDDLGCNRINAATPKEARDARRFLEKFGFKREGVATDGFGPGKDVICSRLLKREWLQTKWVQPRVTE